MLQKYPIVVRYEESDGTATTNPTAILVPDGSIEGEQVDLSATQAPEVGALRFDETKAHHVNHGAFWIGGEEYTSFYWDAFVRPRAVSTLGYVISAGYGGNHNLLLGFNSNATHAAVTGNIWDGDSVVEFSTAQVIPLGDWVHIAVTWDLLVLRVYINGVIEGSTTYEAETRSTETSVESVLFVGGSDHLNFGFDLKWIRGFEGTLPFTFSNLPYRPERFPRAYYQVSSTDVPAAFLADYSKKCEIIPDLSKGFGAQGTHPGRRATGADGGDFNNGGSPVKNNHTDSDLPQWVEATVVAPTEDTTVVPVGAKIYDDFNRTSSPFWVNTQGLGSTEGGSLGILAWQGSANLYGCSYGRCFGWDGNGGITYVDSGSQTQDVRIQSAVEGHQFSTILRYQDANNYIEIATSPIGDGTDSVFVVKKVAGVTTVISNFTSGPGTSSASLIRVTVSENDISVYFDGVSIYAGTDLADLPTGTGVGFSMVALAQCKIDSFGAF